MLGSAVEWHDGLQDENVADRAMLVENRAFMAIVCWFTKLWSRNTALSPYFRYLIVEPNTPNSETSN